MRKETIAHQIAEHIEDSVRYIHLHGEIQESERTWIQDIAKSLSISPSQVNRIFRQVYGIGFAQVSIRNPSERSAEAVKANRPEHRPYCDDARGIRPMRISAASLSGGQVSRQANFAAIRSRPEKPALRMTKSIIIKTSIV